MKKVIVFLFLTIIINIAKAQNANPFVAQGNIAPAPLYDAASGGTGQISLIVGNSGDVEIPYITNNELVINITLSNGEPNNLISLNAISGNFKTYFNWSYNSITKTYTGIQNKNIPIANNDGSGYIFIDYKVTANSNDTNLNNGFIATLNVPSLSAAFNTLADDTVSAYTWTIPSADISSGNDGGLESNGNLSYLIGKRYFIRQQEIPKNIITNQVAHTNNAKTRSILNQFVPSFTQLSLTPFISTPTDLLSITNALDILSVDYYTTANLRTGTVLITETDNKIYNHTKAICDRLKNATLLEIKQKTINSIDFLTYVLKQDNGQMEYITCFSMSEDATNYTIHNQWLIGQYPLKNTFYNFQIWASSEALCQNMVENTLKNINNIKPYVSDSLSKTFPTVYFRKGNAEQNKLTLEIKNNTSNRKINIAINYTHTEQESRETLNYPIDILPFSTQTVSIPFDGLFDADINLIVNNITLDEMYLADGAWGIDYPKSTSVLNNFTINTFVSGINNPDDYNQARSANVEANIDEYITLYKMLKPANLAANVSTYQYVNIDVQSNDDLIIRLNKKSINNWAKQAKYKLINNGNQQLSIPISYFKNELNEQINVNDLTSVSFSLVANNVKNKNAAIAIHKLSFSNKPAFNVLSENTNLTAYPNPINNSSNINLTFNATASNTGQIKIFNVLGEIIYQQNINVNKGYNKISIPNTIVASGNYILELNSNNSTQQTVLTSR